MCLMATNDLEYLHIITVRSIYNYDGPCVSLAYEAQARGSSPQQICGLGLASNWHKQCGGPLLVHRI